MLNEQKRILRFKKCKKRQTIFGIFYRLLSGRGRNTGCPVPPAQIPASATNALGSSLEYERQSGNKDVDVTIEFLDRNER